MFKKKGGGAGNLTPEESLNLFLIQLEGLKIAFFPSNDDNLSLLRYSYYLDYQDDHSMADDNESKLMLKQ